MIASTLKGFQADIKKFAAKKEVVTILCYKSWRLFNESGTQETYIFRKDGNLFRTVNGVTETSKWEFMPENGAILLIMNDCQTMWQPAYTDDLIFVFKQMGKDIFLPMYDEALGDKFPSFDFSTLNSYLEKKHWEAEHPEEVRLVRAAAMAAEEKRRKEAEEEEERKQKEEYAILSKLYEVIFEETRPQRKENTKQMIIILVVLSLLGVIPVIISNLYIILVLVVLLLALPFSFYTKKNNDLIDRRIDEYKKTHKEWKNEMLELIHNETK